MRFFKRIAGFLGFSRDDDGGQELGDQEDYEDADDHPNQQPQFRPTGLPRKGFSVPVQVSVDRPQLAPLLVPCASGEGGVQGLEWYTKRLRIDEDGDVADEFFEEVLSETSDADDPHKPFGPFPRFKVKYSTRPAKIKQQVMTQDGKIRQCVEYQGRLQWV